jgi:3D (Asp-Asp-Asp) domain-containing protein
MIGLILKQMNAMEIISTDQVNLLRNHLRTEYPKVPAAEIERIISEYMIQIVDRHLTYFSVEYRQRLKDILLKNTMSYPIMGICDSDLFKAGLELNAEEPFFRHELARWVSEHPIDNIGSEEVYDLLIKQLHPGQSEDMEIVKTDMETTVQILPIVVNEENNGLIPQPPSYTRFSLFMVKLEMLSKKSMETLATTMSLSVAIGLAIILLLLCPWIFNNRIEAKETEARIAAAHRKKPVENQPEILPAANLARYGNGNSAPIEEEPNALIVGYVKLKTANGLFDIPVKEIFERKLRAQATAYDLSVKSCGKGTDHPEYGITASGTKAVKGRTIAVDPAVIPLGSKVYIIFPEKYRQLNGIYVAEDTGKHVKGYEVDVFLGEDDEGENQIRNAAHRFGVQKVEIFILKKK